MKKKGFDCIKMVREIRDRNASKSIHNIVLDAQNHVSTDPLTMKLKIYK